jgi:hypothetical protein
MESAHDLNVKRLERVAGGLDKEDTCMNTVVNNIHAVNLVLSIQVGVESLLDVVDDRAPRLIIVDKISKTWCIDNSEAETNTCLLNVGADGLNGNSLGNNVEAGSLALLGGVQGGVEESVDQSRLAQARLT